MIEARRVGDAMNEEAVRFRDDAAATSGALGALVSALPEPVLLVGTDGRIICANAAAADLFGNRLEGTPALAHFRQPDTMRALSLALAALHDGAGDEAFTARKVIAAPGRETIYRFTARPLPEAAGLKAVLVALHDISHAEEAEQQRRDFVANVSHELRSPLTALAGFIETLQGSARHDPQAQEAFLPIMAQEAERMTRLVDDLLSLSRVESNEKIRPRDRVALREVLQATLAALRPKIEASGIEVTLPDLTDPFIVPGDYPQLVQVFHNLVENALKYGGEGGRIELDLERLESVPGLDGPAISLCVTDHGAGIHPIHLPRLTERFYRVGGDRARQTGGTGLGLAIVKHIVNRHRGRLTIRSAPGEGSAFCVLLPCG